MPHASFDVEILKLREDFSLYIVIGEHIHVTRQDGRTDILNSGELCPVVKIKISVN